MTGGGEGGGGMGGGRGGWVWEGVGGRPLSGEDPRQPDKSGLTNPDSGTRFYGSFVPCIVTAVGLPACYSMHVIDEVNVLVACIVILLMSSLRCPPNKCLTSVVPIVLPLYSCLATCHPMHVLTIHITTLMLSPNACINYITTLMLSPNECIY